MTFAAGLVIVTGGFLPPDSVLTARIGDAYESAPSAILTSDGQFGGLVVDPKDNSFIGQDIGFYINGQAARTMIPFESGGLRRQFRHHLHCGIPHTHPNSRTVAYAKAGADSDGDTNDHNDH